MDKFRFFIYNKSRDEFSGKLPVSFPSHAKAEEWIMKSGWRSSQLDIRYEAAWRTADEVSIANNQEA